jgi:hypothetical protein
MQDSGPDMEELLNKASEDYPLKNPVDKWDIIQDAIVHQQDSSEKRRNLTLVLMPFLLSALMLAGLAVGDSGKITYGKAEIATSRLTMPSHKTDKVVRTAAAKRARSITSEVTISNLNNIHTLLPPKPQLSATFDSPPLTASKKFLVATPGVNGLDIKTELVPSDFFNALSPSENLQLSSAKLKKGFYYGIMAGLDVNAVKDQPFGNSNFEIGAIAGYRISRRMSLESGVSLVKKYYDTKGKYFKMDDMPGGAEMMEVDGSSKLIRIPFHIQTQLIDRKYQVFVSSGVSSYLMTEENNEYHVMMNGTEHKMFGSYTNNRNYFAATLDFSAGIERQIGAKNQVRFQPYLHLPLKGIGVGKLPIRSAGIRIGFIHNH